MTKICKTCFCEKSFSAFYFNNQHRLLSLECRVCTFHRSRRWRLTNPKRSAERKRHWGKLNPENRRTNLRNWRKKKGPAQDSDTLTHRLRERMRYALAGAVKAASTRDLLGCSFLEFKEYLENQFSQRPGMSWETKCFWEIDHIKPCASFDLRDPAQQKQCFHFSNQRPVWKFENRSKGCT